MELFGGAGHSIEIAKRLRNTGLLIGIDRDEEAIDAAKQTLIKYDNIKYIHRNHDQIQEILSEMKIKGVDRNTFRLRSFFISIR